MKITESDMKKHLIEGFEKLITLAKNDGKVVGIVEFLK